MSTKTSKDFYNHFWEMSSVRALAESAFNESNNQYKIIENPSMKDLYEFSCCQKGVTITDLPIARSVVEKYELFSEAKVLNDNHGKIVGRKAKARRFYNQLDEHEKEKMQGILREAMYEFSSYERIAKDAVVGTNSELMLKARLLTTKSNSCNAMNWCFNFTPFETVEQTYIKSKPREIQDILVVCFPEWSGAIGEYAEGLVVIDPYENVIFILGLRYFGEMKKGTLTLAWTSGLRLGMVACHGGIKEIDFSNTSFKNLGRKSISFFGLSGSGKSSHTNAVDNGGTLPEKALVTIAHDDAFQIDFETKRCLVWEPSLFDKTDSREFNHPDWNFCVSTQNHAVLNIDGKRLPYGKDLRNNNGRAIFTREILGGRVENQVGFPNIIVWLMKDETLPPLMYIEDPFLAVAMGATLMTKRSAAENVSSEEMKKLVFEPFANPFRVYDLVHDCEGFLRVFESGTKCFVFNSGSYFNGNDEDYKKIPLSLSLNLQTAILKESLKFEKFSFLEGAKVPDDESAGMIWKHYQANYSFKNLSDEEKYISTMADRFKQRREYLGQALKNNIEMAEKLAGKLVIKG